VKFILNSKYVLTSTSHGSIKLFETSNYDEVGVLNSSVWPEEQI